MMSDSVELTVDGRAVRVPSGTSVAVAVMIAGDGVVRRSVSGEPRAPLCGMGICFECRVRIDGHEAVRSCGVICRAGMKVETDVR